MIENLTVDNNGLKIVANYSINSIKYETTLYLQTGHDLVKKSAKDLILEQIIKEHNL